MKNYNKSDYALNKFSGSIVYQFADQIIEVTLEDYLRENPDKTEQDFLILKELSDSIYKEQDRKEYVQTKKNVSLHGLEETNRLTTKTLEEAYIEQMENELLEEAIRECLTEKQARRIRLCVYQGLSCRKIARIEGIHFRSIYDSLVLARKKLNKYFEKK